MRTKGNTKVDWDQIVSKRMSTDLYNLMKESLELENLPFPRGTKPPKSIGSPTVVSFWDGSFQATCSVVYVVWKVENPDGGRKLVSSIVAAKGKTTPLKGLTVPRAECNALLMCTRLTKMIISCLPVVPKNVVLIGDSQCIISAVENTTSLFTPFMQNRIGEIIENIREMKNICPVEDLMYVKSELNIADIGTRSAGKLKDMGLNTAWQRGPEFLCLPRDKWPVGRDFLPLSLPKEEIKLAPQLMSCAVVAESTDNSLIKVFMKMSNKLEDVEYVVGSILFKLKKYCQKNVSFQECVLAAQREILLSEMSLTHKALSENKLESLMVKRMKEV